MVKKRVDSFEDLDVYRIAVKIGDKIWKIVASWPSFPRNSLGYQLVKSSDSIGANIAEGFGRFHFAENKQFARIARGSLYETRHWLQNAYKRDLIKENEMSELLLLLNELTPRLNAYIRSIGSHQNRSAGDQ